MMLHTVFFSGTDLCDLDKSVHCPFAVKYFSLKVAYIELLSEVSVIEYHPSTVLVVKQELTCGVVKLSTHCKLLISILVPAILLKRIKPVEIIKAKE